MGAYGSGRKGGRYGAARTTVETCCTIDINALHRLGVLQSGKQIELQWALRRGDTRLADTTAIVKGDDAGVWLGNVSFDYVTGTVRKALYPVSLKWVPCTYGGARPYFVCPAIFEPCGRRAEKLYLPPKEEHFACRRCWNLTYGSSNASGDVQRVAELRRERAARKLGVTGRDGIYAAKRPKGMHRKTFRRLCRAALQALDDEDDAFEYALTRHLKL